MVRKPAMFALAAALCTTGFMTTAPAEAQSAKFTLTRLEPIDGRTFEVENGAKFQLSGIHVPAPGQTCIDENRQSYDCGARAVALLDRLGNGLVECLELPANGGSYVTVRCYDFANRDIAAVLVRHGWAVPDTNTNAGMNYTFDAMEAEARQKGMWQGEFTMPAW